MLAMAPAQWGQQCHHDNGKDACASTMVRTPSWQGQQHQLDDGKDAIATRTTILLQQWQRRLDSKDPCASTTATSLQQGQWCQLNDSKDACALMTATTLLLRGQQCKLNDYASLITAETPLQQGWQLPLQQWQRCLHINGKNAIATREKTPSWWWQGSLHINDDNYAIATRTTMPAWGRQHCYRNKGNNAVMDQGRQCHCYEGNKKMRIKLQQTILNWKIADMFVFLFQQSRAEAWALSHFMYSFILK
jgi:hypothetical protein